MGSPGAFASGCRHGEVAMSPVAKRVLLVVSLLCMAALNWFSSPAGTDDVMLLSPRVQAKSAPASDAARAPSVPASSSPTGNALRVIQTPIDVLGIVARDGDMPEDDTDGRLFTPVSWKVAEVEKTVAPVARVVEKPSAPALPFAVLGRYEDKQHSVVFLQQGEQNLAVHVGDKIGTNYQVESLNSANLVLRYLPTNQLQTLEVGGAQ